MSTNSLSFFSHSHYLRASTEVPITFEHGEPVNFRNDTRNVQCTPANIRLLMGDAWGKKNIRFSIKYQTRVS